VLAKPIERGAHHLLAELAALIAVGLVIGHGRAAEGLGSRGALTIGPLAQQGALRSGGLARLHVLSPFTPSTGLVAIIDRARPALLCRMRRQVS
jgi:hypothetical protein